ncbi:MAG: short-chain dehydrogenase [Chloroflexi bacterium]|nr:MAG: short-chain dehydrogenase [Chloroflexota bacterium]
MNSLEGKVAVVAGATRGAGRGIACMLGERGATVYCTGRSTRAKQVQPQPEADRAAFTLTGRPETIEETAEMVTGYGGVGIPVQVDHTVEAQVKALFERVRAEQGQLDILVNDVWGGDELTEWGKPFWELDLAKGFLMMERAIYTHIITSRYGAPLLVERGEGLIAEITDGDSPNYRGNLFYDLVKSSAIRLAYGMAEELRPHKVAAVAVTPGFLRSEAMLDHFGVTEANWQEGAKQDPHFIASETPFYVGRAVAALAADPNIMAKTGQAFASWNLAEEYGFTDVDGRRPHWGRYFAEHVQQA